VLSCTVVVVCVRAFSLRYVYAHPGITCFRYAAIGVKRSIPIYGYHSMRCVCGARVVVLCVRERVVVAWSCDMTLTHSLTHSLTVTPTDHSRRLRVTVTTRRIVWQSVCAQLSSPPPPYKTHSLTHSLQRPPTVYCRPRSVTSLSILSQT